MIRRINRWIDKPGDPPDLIGDALFRLTKAMLVYVLVPILVILMIAALAGCEKAPTRGNVIDKRYEPAHWEGGYETEYRTEFRCRPVSTYNYNTKQYDTTTACGVEQVPYDQWEDHHTYVQDRWRLRLEDCTVKDGKRKCKRGWITVGEQTYGRYNLGNHYPDPR